MSFRFEFELDAVKDVEPWGEPERKSLSWFGLTSGRYWIETAVGEVLRYTDGIQRLWNFEHRHVDYYVARLFEDMQERFPATLEPVPDDVAALGTDRRWLERLDKWIADEIPDEGQAEWDLYEAAMSWFWAREIDTQYLSFGPRIHAWRVDGQVFFRWRTRDNLDRGVPVFAVPDGETVIAVEKSWSSESVRSSRTDGIARAASSMSQG